MSDQSFTRNSYLVCVCTLLFVAGWSLLNNSVAGGVIGLWGVVGLSVNYAVYRRRDRKMREHHEETVRHLRSGDAPSAS